MKCPVKNKNKKTPRKRKTFVFGEEQDSTKELFEKDKGSRLCSLLIAESLGLSVAQVNLKHKLLCLDATLRKGNQEMRIPALRIIRLKRKVPEAWNNSVNNSEMVEHYSDKDDNIVSGVADEGDSDSEPLTSKLKRSQNIGLSKGKMNQVCKEFPNKSVVVKFWRPE
ncbi:hypothetical protein KI387_031816 [Taxus chinensis]|uniref:Uncharacterized protein n=1 Tax=Taxus chinensis TaxID=29808 RepID=A0AA38BXH1_TAXCH|nr:hypothetical protein KI387_031816 [Taxus chinensis]